MRNPNHKKALAPKPQTRRATSLPDHSKTNAAYERRLREIESVTELIPITIDLPTAIATVLGALPQIQALKKEMATLPIDEPVLDGLDDYAEACAEANARYVTAVAPAEEVVALNEAALALRETLRSDAAALVQRGLLDEARLAAFQGHTGYKNVGFDLIDYATLFRDCWTAIQGKTALTIEEVQAAKDLGDQLVRAAGEHQQTPAVIAETALIRQQAFTLMVNAYDEARRAISFLRWRTDDVNTIAPSLYAGRTHRTVAPDPTPAPTPPEPTPAPTPPEPTPPVTGAVNGRAANGAARIG